MGFSGVGCGLIGFYSSLVENSQVVRFKGVFVRFLGFYRGLMELFGSMRIVEVDLGLVGV